MTSQIWTDPVIMEWSQLLLNSFRHWTGRDLLERVGDQDYQAHMLFSLPLLLYPTEWKRIRSSITAIRWHWTCGR